MGCDIHGCVEVKTRYGWWEYAMDIKPWIERNYTLFGLYFGCRNYHDVIPLFAFRGFPPHVDYDTKERFYGPEYNNEDFDEDKVDLDTIDNHSLSYTTLKELNNLPEEVSYIKYGLEGQSERPPIGEGLGPLYYKQCITNTDMEALNKGKTVKKIVDGKHYWFCLDKMRFSEFEPKLTDIRDLTRFMNLLREKFDDVRMIVWFDN